MAGFLGAGTACVFPSIPSIAAGIDSAACGGVVAHQSGIRVPPGLRGRAAYADGVRTANPKVRLLTNFSGNQDDVALADRITRAQAKQGADIIFTMLNAGRSAEN